MLGLINGVVERLMQDIHVCRRVQKGAEEQVNLKFGGFENGKK